MFIIGLSGKIGSGKSTTAQLLQARLAEKNISAPILGFGAMIKKELTDILNVPAHLMETQEGKNSIYHSHTGDYQDFWLFERRFTIPTGVWTIRKLLQFWGTDVRRNFDPNYWVKALAAYISKNNINHCIVDDVRFINEASYILRHGPLYRILHYGPTLDPHVSETALDNFDNFSLVVQPKFGELPAAADQIFEHLWNNFEFVMEQICCNEQP